MYLYLHLCLYLHVNLFSLDPPDRWKFAEAQLVEEKFLQMNQRSLPKQCHNYHWDHIFIIVMGLFLQQVN